MESFFHSVTLDRKLCKGCINCVKRCPTEAIRVQNGKAKIIKERCIDCGECIRICPHHAKQAVYDPLSILDRFEYTIALPAPSLYGQFNHLDRVDIVLDALLQIGFDAVYEVARAAEYVSDITRTLLEKGGLPKPVISSACPAVVRLIRVRFPELLPHVLPVRAPMEVAAQLAKAEAVKKTGLPPEKIGAIFISPCPAKVTAVKMPIGVESCAVDGVVAAHEIYSQLLRVMKPGSEAAPRQQTAGRIGIRWGQSGGEADALAHDQYLAADGIENVIRVLESMEDDQLGDVEFVELNACSGGCVGGVLNVENPYVAKTKLERLSRFKPVYRRDPGPVPQEMFFDHAIEFVPVMQLDPDVSVAIEKLRRMEEIESRLYGIDCGSCGAPSCRALAEDIVRGFNTEMACIYVQRAYLQSITQEMSRLADNMPGEEEEERQEE